MSDPNAVEAAVSLREAAERLTSMESVLVEVMHERARQDGKWGPQNHIDGTGPDVRVLKPMDFYLQHGALGQQKASTLARVAQAACQANGSPERPGTWTAILLEEVFEALAEEDPQALREELIQTAAVCVAWAQAIDRRTV